MSPQFGDLPPELREYIWKFSLPTGDEREVCVLPRALLPQDQEVNLPAMRQFRHTHQLTVYTAFPVLMHVCRESRAIIHDYRQKGVTFKNVKIGVSSSLAVPARPFRPELDILYLPPLVTNEESTNMIALGQLCNEPNVRRFLSNLRYIAVASSASVDFIARHLIEYCHSLRNVSVVVACSAQEDNSERLFEAPKGRCQLLSLMSDAEEERLTPWQHEVTLDDLDSPSPVQRFLAEYCIRLNGAGREAFSEIFPNGGAEYVGTQWDYLLKYFMGFSIQVVTSLEYTKDGWAEGR